MDLKILRGRYTIACHRIYRNLGSRIILLRFTWPITPKGSLAHVWVLVFRVVKRGSMFSLKYSSRERVIVIPRYFMELT